MVKHFPSAWMLSGMLFAALFAVPTASAQDAATPKKAVVREIFVPFEDLNVLLDSQIQRVFLTRKEYEELLTKAKRTPQEKSLRMAVLLSADYQGKVEEGRAQITGTLMVDVLSEGIHALTLELSGVGLRQITIDGKPAPVGVNAQRQPVLFLQDKGRKKVELELVAPLETTAALQSLKVQLPAVSSARIELAVPGNVDVKSGASVLKREVNAEKNVTQFDLLLPRGMSTLVMTLNNRQLMKQRAVVARSVLVDEITKAYERLHATVSLGVLHGAIEQVQFLLPDGFEVTTVTSPLLSRWVVENVGDTKARHLTITLREPTTETIVLNLSAVRTPVVFEKWQFPQLQPVDVAGEAAVVGLLVEDRLKAESLAPTGLIPIDTSILSLAFPESVFQAEPGSPQVRTIAAYFAPQAKYGLAATFSEPPAKFDVTTNLVLVLDEKQHQVRGTFTALPQAEKLFSVDFSVPTGWQVQEVTNPSGKPLSFETYPAAKGSRVRILLPAGLLPGVAESVNFRASYVPNDWLANWRETKINFPVFAVIGAERDEGAIAVHSLDDLKVRPDQLDQLVPLDETEKGAYGLEGITTDLVYRYESQPYSATFEVRHVSPEITARTFSFFHVETERLLAHYEIAYEVRNARTQTLTFSLPATTPHAISVTGLDNVVVKEYNAEDPVADMADPNPAAGMRIWTVSLADRRNGQLRLQIEFEQLLAMSESAKAASKKISLPRIIAGAVGATAEQAGRYVQYASGLVAVEGNSELDVQVAAPDGTRKIDVGELAEADYQVGRHLLVAYGFTGDGPQLALDIARRPGVEIPTAIVQRAELVTMVSASGMQATACRYHLRTKSLLLEIRLPAGAKLWSAQVDGKPISPQRDGDSLLLSLTTAGGETLRDLQLVYEAAGGSLSLLSRIEAVAPRLFLRDERGEKANEVPIADVRWNLSLPAGYRVVGNRGTVFPDMDDNVTLSQLGPRTSPWSILAQLPVGMIIETRFAKGYKTTEVAGRLHGLPSGYYYHDDIQYPKSEAALSDLPMTPAAEDAAKSLEAAAASDMPAKMPAKPAAAYAPPPVAEAKPSEERERARRDANGDKDMAEDKKARDPRRLGVKGALDRPPTNVGGKEIVKEELSKADDQTRSGKIWALEGVRSLPVDFTSYLNSPFPMLAFESLGADPELQVTVTHEQRLNTLGWGLAFITILVGLMRLGRPAKSKFAFLVTVLAIVTILPLLMPWEQAVGNVCDHVFWAAWFLVPIYFAIGFAKWCSAKCRCCGWRRKPDVVVTTITAALAILFLFAPSAAWAQKPVTLGENEIIIPLGERLKPVKVPDDAIILPYDGDDKDGVAKAEKVMVPYDKYAELWNLAYPDKKLKTELPPVPYTLAGAAYTATLDGNEFLTLQGVLEIELFTDDAVDVPLALQGGVLAEAKVDGKPARLRVINAQPIAKEQAPPPQKAMTSRTIALPQQAQSAVPEGDKREILALVLSGKGRKKLEVVIRLHLERRGGWRIAEGRVPVAAATSLTLTSPAAQTEVRLTGVPDRLRFETTKANEKIETALRDEEPFSIQWRPKVAEGEVDKSLTARSQIELEARDDALRFAWQVTLEFPRSRRENFTLDVPSDYLVERVIGGNVRGWVATKNDARQKIEVTLLKAVADSESFTVFLSRRGRVGTGELASFPLPVFNVTDAALHQGTIAIRRSPLLDLRINDLRGLTRTDTATAAQALESDPYEQSVLVSRPFQTYRFQSINYSATLSAAEVSATVTARLQSVLRITDRDARLETLVNLKVAQRPLHQIRLQVPPTFVPNVVQLRTATPVVYDWSLTDIKEGAGAGQKLLTVQLTTGQSGDFGVVVEGTLGRRKESDPVPLPKVRVLNVTEQEGDIVVQVDPAMNVTADQLKDCESVLLGKDSTVAGQRFGWLSAAQRDVARLAIRYRTPDYAGSLKLARRQPRVSCFTVTNIRVTTRAIEETIGLDFHIEDAGVREVSFLLPAWMRNARVNTRLLRQSIVEDVAKADDAANSQAQVRFRLEFQDEVMGTLQVVVQNDRLLTDATQAVPIPIVETGRTDQRLIALESAGRGEVVFDKQIGVEPLTRQQQPWRKLSELFGENLTVAYSVQDDARKPLLTYRTKDRALVETAAARIGIAETEFQLDSSGAYRARVTYRMDNSTEPFLVVQLPDHSRLWTVRVAGEPVKPTEVPGGAVNQVRIPLVKTAPGDADYPVVLTYAGKMPALGSYKSLRFPFVKTVNINVEMSLVRLSLPRTHEWFDFGGTMSALPNEGDYKASYFEYQTKQVQQLTRLLQSNPDELTQLRCANNLKQLEVAVTDFAAANSFFNSNDSFNKSYIANNATLQQAKQQLDQQQTVQSEQMSAAVDNRERLNERVERQHAGRAKNVVGKLGRNFDFYANAPDTSASPNMPAQTQSGAQAFNSKWLESNKLAPAAKTAGQKAANGEPLGDRGAGRGRVVESNQRGVQTEGLRFGKNIENPVANDPQSRPQNGQPQIPNANPGNEAFRRQLEEIDAKGKSQQAQPQSKEGAQQDIGRRYQQRLEQQNQLQELDKVQQFSRGVNSPEPVVTKPNAAPSTPGGGATGSNFRGAGQGFRIDQGGPGGGGGLGGFGINLPQGPGKPIAGDIAMARDEAMAANQALADPQAHLASLDIELPRRGTEYFFKTPRGEIEITVQTVSASLAHRALRLLLAAIGLAIVGGVFVVVRRWMK